MKIFGLNFIFLIVTSFLASLQAQSIIQCVENIPGNIRSDGGALITPSVSDKEMTEEKNSSFKPPKKTGHIFLSQFSKGEGGSRFKLDKARHKLGFITGYGNEKAFNVMYTYEVIFFQFQYYYSLLGKKGWGVELLLQPQYNITKYKNGFSGEEKMNGHEFGLNMGFLVRKNIVKGIFSSYVIISAGPHYISGAPGRQADGFIFSDNFLAGISVKVFKSVYIDVRGGFRHLSNAGFKNPNKGINSLILNTGLFLQL